MPARRAPAKVSRSPSPAYAEQVMAYHHGDLRQALLDEAIEVIASSGVAALSLRDLARRAGVSHAAPTHHFGDKAGLLTVLATEGYTQLGDALLSAPPTFLDQGVAYV